MDMVQIDAVHAESPLTTSALDTQRTAASSARGTPGVLLKFGLPNDQDEPQTDAVVSYALKGGVAMGSLGGASGSALGGVLGAVVGLPPAVLTFGLSVPVCATIGSSLGLCIGSVAGGSVGLLGGSVIGRLTTPRGDRQS